MAKSSFKQGDKVRVKSDGSQGNILGKQFLRGDTHHEVFFPESAGNRSMETATYHHSELEKLPKTKEALKHLGAGKPHKKAD